MDYKKSDTQIRRLLAKVYDYFEIAFYLVMFNILFEYLRSFNLIGGTEEVWASRKLAERVHHGGHSYTAEKGDGSPT